MTAQPPHYPFADLHLARLLEGAEAHANRRFVESRARIAPDTGACWSSADGALAMFDGVGSPLTQTFGLGLFEPATHDGFNALETFFASRGADVFHEVSPPAGPSALAMLNERGYQPHELTNVMFRPIDHLRIDRGASAGIVTRLAGPDDLQTWAATAVRGWSEFPELLDFIAAFGMMAVGAEDAFPFVAEADARPIATGLLTVHGDVALLAGASTVVDARGRGAQHALLAARLQYAAAHGCRLAMMCASPGSGSQRNAERYGFRIAYTRIKWRRSVLRREADR